MCILIKICTKNSHLIPKFSIGKGSTTSGLPNFLCIFKWDNTHTLFLPLQGSDPSTYEQINKIHALQKRLIAKNEEVEEKELLIQEKEKLYIELNHVLARQPGPEVAEQLQVYNSTLKEKNKQIKVRQYRFISTSRILVLLNMKI